MTLRMHQSGQRISARAFLEVHSCDRWTYSSMLSRHVLLLTMGSSISSGIRGMLRSQDMLFSVLRFEQIEDRINVLHNESSHSD